jgi:hypothetical protein
LTSTDALALETSEHQNNVITRSLPLVYTLYSSSLNHQHSEHLLVPIDLLERMAMISAEPVAVTSLAAKTDLTGSAGKKVVRLLCCAPVVSRLCEVMLSPCVVR